MTCQVCGDLGIVRLNWSDAPEDYALCLCDAARWYRCDENAGRQTGGFGWQVWCARNEVHPSRMYLLEEVLTLEELQGHGFTAPSAAGAESRDAVLLAVGKTRRARL